MHCEMLISLPNYIYHLELYKLHGKIKFKLQYIHMYIYKICVWSKIEMSQLSRMRGQYFCHKKCLNA